MWRRVIVAAILMRTRMRRRTVKLILTLIAMKSEQRFGSGCKVSDCIIALCC